VRQEEKLFFLFFCFWAMMKTTDLIQRPKAKEELNIRRPETQRERKREKKKKKRKKKKTKKMILPRHPV
jgi:hypothetical protein